MAKLNRQKKEQGLKKQMLKKKDILEELHNSGTGKTHIPIELRLKACMMGYKVLSQEFTDC